MMYKMKKIKIINKMTIIVTIAMLIIAMASIPLMVAAAENASLEETSEAKLICSAKIEDDFADDKVIVTLKQAASLKFKKYTKNSFSEVKVER